MVHGWRAKGHGREYGFPHYVFHSKVNVTMVCMGIKNILTKVTNVFGVALLINPLPSIGTITF